MRHPDQLRERPFFSGTISPVVYLPPLPAGVNVTAGTSADSIWLQTGVHTSSAAITPGDPLIETFDETISQNAGVWSNQEYGNRVGLDPNGAGPNLDGPFVYGIYNYTGASHGAAGGNGPDGGAGHQAFYIDDTSVVTDDHAGSAGMTDYPTNGVSSPSIWGRRDASAPPDGTGSLYPVNMYVQPFPDISDFEWYRNFGRSISGTSSMIFGPADLLNETVTSTGRRNFWGASAAQTVSGRPMRACVPLTNGEVTQQTIKLTSTITDEWFNNGVFSMRLTFIQPKRFPGDNWGAPSERYYILTARSPNNTLIEVWFEYGDFNPGPGLITDWQLHFKVGADEINKYALENASGVSPPHPGGHGVGDVVFANAPIFVGSEYGLQLYHNAATGLMSLQVRSAGSYVGDNKTTTATVALGTGTAGDAWLGSNEGGTDCLDAMFTAVQGLAGFTQYVPIEPEGIYLGDSNSAQTTFDASLHTRATSYIYTFEESRWLLGNGRRGILDLSVPNGTIEAMTQCFDAAVANHAIDLRRVNFAVFYLGCENILAGDSAVTMIAKLQTLKDHVVDTIFALTGRTIPTVGTQLNPGKTFYIAHGGAPMFAEWQAALPLMAAMNWTAFVTGTNGPTFNDGADELQAYLNTQDLGGFSDPVGNFLTPNRFGKIQEGAFMRAELTGIGVLP